MASLPDPVVEVLDRLRHPIKTDRLIDWVRDHVGNVVEGYEDEIYKHLRARGMIITDDLSRRVDERLMGGGKDEEVAIAEDLNYKLPESERKNWNLQKIGGISGSFAKLGKQLEDAAKTKNYAEIHYNTSAIYNVMVNLLTAMNLGQAAKDMSANRESGSKKPKEEPAPKE